MSELEDEMEIGDSGVSLVDGDVSLAIENCLKENEESKVDEKTSASSVNSLKKKSHAKSSAVGGKSKAGKGSSSKSGHSGPDGIDGRAEGEEGEGDGSGSSLTYLEIPKASVKRIIKLNDEVIDVDPMAIATVAKATELFVQLIINRSQQIASESNRKTIKVDDFAKFMMQSSSQLEFLDCIFDGHVSEPSVAPAIVENTAAVEVDFSALVGGGGERNSGLDESKSSGSSGTKSVGKGSGKPRKSAGTSGGGGGGGGLEEEGKKKSASVSTKTSIAAAAIAVDEGSKETPAQNAQPKAIKSETDALNDVKKETFSAELKLNGQGATSGTIGSLKAPNSVPKKNSNDEGGKKPKVVISSKKELKLGAQDVVLDKEDELGIAEKKRKREGEGEGE